MSTTIQQALDNLTRSLGEYFYTMTVEGLTVAPIAEVEDSTDTPDILLFQYKIEDIFTDVKMLSANIAKYTEAVEGAPDFFDRIAITEEDRPLFTRFLNGAALYIYGKVQGLAKTISPSGLMINEGITIVNWVVATQYTVGSYVLRNGTIYKALATVTSDPEVDVDHWMEYPDYADTKNKITIFIANSTNFDIAAVRTWDDNLKDIIAMYVMEKIFKFRMIPTPMQEVVMSERLIKEDELKSSLVTRKAPVRRPVGWL